MTNAQPQGQEGWDRELHGRMSDFADMDVPEDVEKYECEPYDPLKDPVLTGEVADPHGGDQGA